MKNIIIFGATGYIGAYLVDYFYNNLDSAEYSIFAVGKRKTNFFDKFNIQYIQVDVCQSEDFLRLPVDNVYAIVNLIGLLPAYFRDYNPLAYVETNINGSIRILEYARKCHADRVLYTQTWAEQAGFWGKYEKLSPELPRNLIFSGDHAFYSITKSMVVDTMHFYREEYGIKDFIFRLPNVYMYAPQKKYYVNGVEKNIAYRYMIECASVGKDLELWGNPDAFKDILYVKDLCQLICKAVVANLNNGIYNAGTGIKTTLREQIEGYIKVFSPNPEKVKIIEKTDKESFISFVMDIQNAKEELGYEPKYSYIDYLEDYKKEQELKRFDSLWLSKK